jgi:hypothetical protein
MIFSVSFLRKKDEVMLNSEEREERKKKRAPVWKKDRAGSDREAEQMQSCGRCMKPEKRCCRKENAEKAKTKVETHDKKRQWT